MLPKSQIQFFACLTDFRPCTFLFDLVSLKNLLHIFTFPFRFLVPPFFSIPFSANQFCTLQVPSFFFISYFSFFILSSFLYFTCFMFFLLSLFSFLFPHLVHYHQVYLSFTSFFISVFVSLLTFNSFFLLPQFLSVFFLVLFSRLPFISPAIFCYILPPFSFLSYLSFYLFLSSFSSSSSSSLSFFFACMNIKVVICLSN